MTSVNSDFMLSMLVSVELVPNYSRLDPAVGRIHGPIHFSLLELVKGLFNKPEPSKLRSSTQVSSVIIICSMYVDAYSPQVDYHC